jgi:hypothetical protein
VMTSPILCFTVEVRFLIPDYCTLFDVSHRNFPKSCGRTRCSLSFLKEGTFRNIATSDFFFNVDGRAIGSFVN